ncbi:MAG: excinuclease ABC subunit UvrB [Chthoniobacterales bacterium]|nr:excinuclease ABC subunit UvrB [Chthoniobacterales bacterium]
MPFNLHSNYSPRGDQGQAIEKLTNSLRAGNRHQTLLGVTGSGKTFTAANIIANLDRPTLLISHNKTLAAQLYSEFKQFFPNNAVEYFVSYFDYYQPEAYIPRSDTYIEKDSSINDEIERLRLSTTSSLLTRRDVIVIASVSCIYGLGSPEDFAEMLLTIKRGAIINREELLRRMVEMLYERNEIEFSRGTFRVRGDIVDIYPAHAEEKGVRVEFFGDEVERILVFDPLTGHSQEELTHFTLFPAKQFVTSQGKMQKARVSIRQELKERLTYLEENGKYLEAQRLKMRTEYDLEMMQEMGFCSGIENYSRHLTGRTAGATPYTLMDFFPEDALIMIDESHATLPQIGGMYAGDRSRKMTLVEYGFRLPSALDNRPLNFAEFMNVGKQLLYITATPSKFELCNSIVGNQTIIDPATLDRVTIAATQPNTATETLEVTKPGTPLIVEQIIRPTGLLDPKVIVRPLKNQIDETIEWCRTRVERNERVLITTLTKRTAEDLSDYLRGVGLNVTYLHSDIDTIERVEILRALRAGEADILVGINLLREGLDLPEVSLVCILDADKEGFLRSKTSLIQTAGRAARHINGEVILFADKMTESIKSFLHITTHRRERQLAYNQQNNITPQSVSRPVQESLRVILQPEPSDLLEETPRDVATFITELEVEMAAASQKMEYERAALLRDQIEELRSGKVKPRTAGSKSFFKKKR